MSHHAFLDNVITSDRRGRPAAASTSVWGIAFYAGGPWPEKMCIQDYDASPCDGVIRFDVENGFAEYRIVGRCEYGGAYHGQLLTASYQPPQMAEG